MRLVQLNVHPLKSGAIRPLQSARVLPSGLEHDRSWMLVDAEGRMVSAREVHELFTIVADTPATDATIDHALRLRAPGHPDLLLAHPDADRMPVRLFSLELEAVPAGPTADAWLWAVLGRDVRLVWCDDPSARPLRGPFASETDHTAFADAFPVTVASLASLRRLNDWIAERALELGEDHPEPLPIERFRANLVVDGDEPFAEDHWQSLRVGDVEFRVIEPVSRCVMTTLDLDTLSSAKEPIRTLARHRVVDGETLFAAHLVAVSEGTISIGDEVRAD